MLLLLLSIMILIIGFTCPPRIRFKFITKCHKCSYKVRQVLLKSATMLLQSVIGVTKCDDCYKVRQNMEHVHYLLHSIWFSMTFISENHAISYGDHDLILFSFLNCLFFPSIQDEAWNSYWIRDILSNLQLTRVQ